MPRARNIREFLASPNNYTELSLNTLATSVEVTGTELTKLCAVLKGNIRLTELSLVGSEISDGGAAAIGQGLKGNTTLTKLYLFGNQIGDVGAIALVQGLKDNTTLTEFGLSNNKLSTIGTKALAQGLKDNTSLIKLDLDYNYIGNVGAEALAQGLEGNTTLTKLFLNHNQIGTSGAVAIGQRLKGNTTLTKLYLRNNEIGDEGATAIGQGLKGNTTLTELYLRNNEIGDEGATAIGQGLKGNITLTKLDLRNNQIDDSGIAVLKELNIRYLYLPKRPVTQQEVVEVKQEEAVKEVEVTSREVKKAVSEYEASGIFVEEDNLNVGALASIFNSHNNQISDDAGSKDSVESLNVISLKQFGLYDNQIGNADKIALKELNIQSLTTSDQKSFIQQEVVEGKQEETEIINEFNAFALNADEQFMKLSGQLSGDE